MVSLTDDEIDQVHDLLVAKGISYKALKEELLDHLCCLVEGQMESGTGFHSALDHATEEFGPLGIERAQEATLYLLNLKLRKMKKATSILGMAGGLFTIAGTLFKILHYPGASILLVIGLGLIALLFMPFALIVNVKGQSGIKAKAMPISGFVGGIFLILFSLFKIMHWPGASALFILGVGVMLLVFMPLRFIKAYRSAENKWYDVGSLTVVFAGALLMFTLTNFHGYKDQYLKAVRAVETEAIYQYQELTNSIDYKSRALSKTSPEKAQQLKDLQIANELLVASFYDYRNYLLNNENNEHSPFYGEAHTTSNKKALKKYSTGEQYLNALDAFDTETGNDKLSQHISLLDAYEKLSLDITQKQELSAKSTLKLIAKNLENLPKEGSTSASLNMLYVSFLNVTEHELRNYQATLLANL